MTQNNEPKENKMPNKRYRINVRIDTVEGEPKGIFTLSEVIEPGHFNALCVAPLNSICAEQLKHLEGFEFDFSEWKMSKHKLQELKDLYDTKQ